MLHRFAGFELDEARYELRRDGVRIELQPKVMEVLVHLLRQADRTLTRDEILDAVWPDVSVGEASLTRCISQARRALGESEADARIIQTVRGRGYAIGVPVESAERADGVPERAAGPSSSPTRRRRRGLWVAAGLLAAAAGGLLWLSRPFADLDALVAPIAAGEPASRAVAVLPFREVGLESDGQRLGERIALEITDQLGEVTELEVLSPAVAFPLVDGTGAGAGGSNAVAAAADLGVGSLVVGTLRPAGDRLHIDVELVDSATGFRRWSHAYERDPGEASSLQREVAREVAHVLGVRVGSGPRFVRRAADVEASRFLLAGRLAVLSATREQTLEAVALYEAAIEQDPTRVDAYVALAAAYERLWSDDEPGVGWLARARAVALRALELDPEAQEAWVTQGSLRIAQRDWKGAEEALLRALALGRTAPALVELARLRCMEGRAGDALGPVLEALERDPLSPSVQHFAGRVLYYLGEHERAIVHLRRAHQIAPRTAYIIVTFASALAASGREGQATEAFLRAMPGWMHAPLRVHQRLTSVDSGLRLLLRLDARRAGRPCGRDAYETAAVRARIGERDAMLACLAKAARHHLFYVRSEPVFDPYREDPEFRRILRTAGFAAG